MTARLYPALLPLALCAWLVAGNIVLARELGEPAPPTPVAAPTGERPVSAAATPAPQPATAEVLPEARPTASQVQPVEAQAQPQSTPDSRPGPVATRTAEPTREAEIIISSESPRPLLVDGAETQKLPTPVPPGSRVCIAKARFFASQGERWTFQRWRHGPTDECVTLTGPGNYRAIFAHEVLLQVRTAVSDLQRSEWVPYEEPIKLEVPEVVPIDDNSRYRFQQWNDGDSPFAPSNTVVPMKPTSLEIKWIREHLVSVDGPPQAEIRGSGWYAEGSNLTLHAPDVVDGESKSERWKFSRWEAVSFPAPTIANPQNALTAIKVDGPYAIRAIYEKQYLVQARNPVGTLKREWVKEGQEISLETPPVLDVVQDSERLVFKRWEGIDGVASPRIGGPVDKPLAVNAVYERELMLKLNAPYGGSGGGWQKAGRVATVSVPGSVPQMVVLSSNLDYLSGYPAGQPSVQVFMDEPKTLTAFYRTELNLGPVAMLLAAPVGLTFLYLLGRLVSALQQRRGPPSAAGPEGRDPRRRAPAGTTGAEGAETAGALRQRVEGNGHARRAP
ncbi:MAG: hypothetical protein HY690_14750 [Chloroflexi bacterium]|nr:hypothetical protein [Chloroflexota bacterium]